MPTGYTAKIEDDENYTFKQFLLHCATGFGACLDQRDDNIAHPVYNKVSTYHVDELQKAINDLAYWSEITPLRLEYEYKEHAKIATENNKNSLERKEKINKNYKRILEQVNNWQPPTEDHKRLKEFMIEQINLCYDPNNSYVYTQKIHQTATDYKIYKMNKAMDDKEYHHKEYNKELLRVENNNNWIRKLIESV